MRCLPSALPTPSWRLITLGGIASALLLASGCATAPAPQKPAAEPAAVFYPKAPEPPRIQHLATYIGEADLMEKREGFAKFVAGEEKSQKLAQLYGVALSNGRLLAVDSKLAAIASFDFTQRKFSLFQGSGGGRLKLPINITIDSDGTQYVTDTGRNQIMRYDRDNRFLGAFGEQDQFRPVDVAISGDRLYVTDIQHHQIQVLDKRTGKLLFKFGKAGSKEGELFHPTSLAFGPNGDLFVVETGNYRVQRFSAEGKALRTYGEVGDTPGKFARPKGLAIDRAGRMYVGDAAFQNVQIFDADGNVQLAFGQPEKGEGLSLPAAVKIDYENVAMFRAKADPRFSIEYLILVTSQVTPNKVDVFGFGRMQGVDYNRGKPAN